jgi:hypothetical protein
LSKSRSRGRHGAAALGLGCESARGPEADRQAKPLIHLAIEGSLLEAYSHSACARFASANPPSHPEQAAPRRLDGRRPARQQDRSTSAQTCRIFQPPPVIESGKIAGGQTLTVSALRVLHGPYGFVSRRVFVAIPRRSTDVQVGVGSSGKHNPCPGVTHGSREPALR